MTTIETAINTNTATQVDIDDVIGNSKTDALDAVIAAANAAKRALAAANKKRAIVELRQLAVVEARQQMDAANALIQAGNMDQVDDLTTIISTLRRANNALDKALELTFEADAAADEARAAVVKTATAV